MYHSHFNEHAQISSGLYGPILVVEPGEKYDPDGDRLLFFGTAGPIANIAFGPFPNIVMNGREHPAPLELHAGRAYRFRLFNLADRFRVVVMLTNGKQPLQWKAVAKDGAALPPSQATVRRAEVSFEPGEIYDFEFTPTKAGNLALTFGPPPRGPNAPPLPVGLSEPPRRTVTIRVK